jgi:hypothetical protein
MLGSLIGRESSDAAPVLTGFAAGLCKVVAAAGPAVHPPTTRAVQTSTAAVTTNDRILTMITTNTALVCRAFRRLRQPFLEQGALGRIGR